MYKCLVCYNNSGRDICDDCIDFYNDASRELAREIEGKYPETRIEKTSTKTIPQLFNTISLLRSSNKEVINGWIIGSNILMNNTGTSLNFINNGYSPSWSA